MEYRKYRAETLKEAKLKMLLDVGKRGYIIKQKTAKEGGFLGMFGKPMVEITVGILTSGFDYTLSQKNVEYMDGDFSFGQVNKNKGNIYNNKNSINGIYKSDYNITKTTTEELSDYKNALERIKEIGLNLSKIEQGEISPENKNINIDENNIKQELAELRKMIKKIGDKDNYQTKRLENQEDSHKTKIEKPNRNEILKKYLKDYDFTDTIIEKYINLNNYLDIEINENNYEPFLEYVISDMLNNNIKLSDGINIEQDEKKAIALIGPTGVGKTTTLAKLGAYYGIIKGKKVKFISMDNYRVGAVQQLKIYSEIMEIAFSKVTSIEEIQNEIDYDMYDVILIDTAGRNQKNEEDLSEIKEFLDVLDNKVNICLVISSTTKYRDLLEILDRFSVINYTNIIATKIDETNSFGQILSALVEKNLTLSYISFGQSVPEHLKSATKINLMETLFKY